MRVKIALLVALAFGAAALLLAGRGPAAGAAQIGPGTWKLRAATGVTTPGPNQTLRVAVAAGPDGAAFRLRVSRYGAGTCSGGVCQLPLDGDDMFPVVELPPGQGASVDIPSNGYGVAVKVFSSRPDVQVTLQIIDADGKVVALISDYLTPSIRS